MSKLSDRRAVWAKKTGAELREELLLLRREHFNLRMQKAAQQTIKSGELRRVRRDIARGLTVLTARRKAEQAEQQ